ncbi:T9SS type A sorting domain-containing protein [candidate division WOR-3 bacterium]|nr:T9SS type A sorting domain-containing protein [candidate division WOR-3 bacterium]
MRQTLDGGYVIAGQACKYPADVDAWLIKTDSTGDAVWNRRFDAQGSDLQYAVEQTTDSGYILVGFTGPSPGVCDAWLLKTDEYGDVVWTKTFGGAGDDLAYGVQQAGDGGYVAAGCLELPGSTDAWFIRTDSRGDTIWTRTYGGASYDVASSVQQTRDGGYIVAGYTPSQSGRQDAWLIKTDSFGDTLWTRTFGGENWDYAFAVQQTQDDGYILAGWTESFGAGGSDAWLIKTDSLGNVGVGEGRQTLDARRMTLDIRPNPCAGLATVSLKPQAPSSKPQTLRVYDASGSLVLSRASGVERQATSVVLDLRGQPSGVYTLRLGSVTTRLVVQH